jgi:hypothetical protein
MIITTHSVASKPPSPSGFALGLVWFTFVIKPQSKPWAPTLGSDYGLITGCNMSKMVVTIHSLVNEFFGLLMEQTFLWVRLFMHDPCISIFTSNCNYQLPCAWARNSNIMVVLSKLEALVEQWECILCSNEMLRKQATSS